MNIKYLFAVIMMCFVLVGQAQKYGHVNSQKILLEFPELKTADSQLQAYQKQLEDDFASKGQAFEKEYNAFVAMNQSGEYSAVQIQKEQERLTAKQQTLQNLQQESQNKILIKREELYAPILKKVEDAVKAVGEEQGYTMIFDSSAGLLLHAEDSQDLYEPVKAKLGF